MLAETAQLEQRVRESAEVEQSPKRDGKEALGPSFPPFQNCGIPHLFGYYLFKPLKKKKVYRKGFLGKSYFQHFMAVTQ